MRWLVCTLFLGQSVFAQPAGILPQYVKTSGTLPMLSYSPGGDRLGGAKMGYIDTGIRLRVLDTLGSKYLVQLSKTHTAYVEKEYVVPDGPAATRSFYLTNSWSVRGDAQYDYVSINIDEKLPYQSWMEIKPSRIVLKIYGAQNNTNWITQLRSAREVNDVYLQQEDDDVVKVIIELKHAQQWGYSVHYAGRNLVVRVRHQPADVRLKKMVVAIDAGHGGDNTGAVGSAAEIQEKIYTLRFAEALRHELEKKGARVIMTRQGDTTIANTDRVLALQQAMPHLLVSLHLNSSANKSVQGASTYYRHIGFRPVSQNILERMLQLNLHEFGNVGHFNFALNAPTDFVNTLVEIAFISNADDEKRIVDPRFHQAVARQIRKGITDWLHQVAN